VVAEGGAWEQAQAGQKGGHACKAAGDRACARCAAGIGTVVLKQRSAPHGRALLHVVLCWNACCAVLIGQVLRARCAERFPAVHAWAGTCIDN
jgi:hypothetical protein